MTNQLAKAYRKQEKAHRNWIHATLMCALLLKEVCEKVGDENLEAWLKVNLPDADPWVCQHILDLLKKTPLGKQALALRNADEKGFSV